ncbi:MAG: cytochrome C oxidase subunit IV family protein [Myxococcaceae bacterium]|nr:cytochrome C oxidase subunit IV family protein [Myxococcaceae bacterium]
MADITKNVTDSHHPADLEHHGAGAYYLVWIALLALTGLTWWTGQMHLPNFGLALALIIATTKAALVVLFFMHLWEQKGVNRVTFVCTIAFVIVMLLGTLGDVTTRLETLLPKREAPASELSHMPKHGEAPAHGAQHP